MNLCLSQLILSIMVIPTQNDAEKLKLRLAGLFIKENSLDKEYMFIKIKNEIEEFKRA